MASKASAPVTTWATVFLLLLVVARPTEANFFCNLGCLMKCTGSLDTYPMCVITCILTSCKGHITSINGGVPDPSVHCSIGCVTSTCVGPKFAGTKEKQGCVKTCAGGCNDAYVKKID